MHHTHTYSPAASAGKLDQAGRRLVVSRAAARDVRPEALPHVAAGLEAWIEASEVRLSGCWARTRVFDMPCVDQEAVNCCMYCFIMDWKRIFYTLLIHVYHAD